LSKRIEEKGNAAAHQGVPVHLQTPDLLLKAAATIGNIRTSLQKKSEFFILQNLVTVLG
jgi:hypothetical protein